MRQAGLVQSDPDPTDAQKTLISISDSSIALRERTIAPHNSWLAWSVDSTLEAEERATLGKAIELLERLANADT